MEIVLYSTGCPKCSVIKRKLDAKGVEYAENNNIGEMMNLGISHVPVLSVDGKLLSFVEANQWVNER